MAATSGSSSARIPRWLLIVGAIVALILVVEFWDRTYGSRSPQAFATVEAEQREIVERSIREAGAERGPDWVACYRAAFDTIRAQRPSPDYFGSELSRELSICNNEWEWAVGPPTWTAEAERERYRDPSDDYPDDMPEEGCPGMACP